MKKYLIAFLIIALFGFKDPFQISGKYKVIYDKEHFQNGEIDYIIEFREKNYTKQIGKEETITGGITRIYNEKNKILIQLRDFVFSHPKVELDKIKPKGTIILEFEESDTDTIYFRTTFNEQLDITLNTGKLIKIKTIR